MVGGSAAGGQRTGAGDRSEVVVDGLGATRVGCCGRLGGVGRALGANSGRAGEAGGRRGQAAADRAAGSPGRRAGCGGKRWRPSGERRAVKREPDAARSWLK